MNGYRGLLSVCLLLPYVLQAHESDVYLTKSESVKKQVQKIHYLTTGINKDTDKSWNLLYLAYYLRGEAYQKIGFHQEAVDSFRSALIYFPDYLPAREALAKCYFELKEWKEVVATLNLLEKKQKGPFLYFEERGLSYYYLEDYDLAVQNFYSAIESGYYSASLLEKILFASFYLKKYDHVLEILHHFDSQIKEDSFFYFIKGLTYFLMYTAREEKFLKKRFAFFSAEKDDLLCKWKSSFEKSFYRASQCHFSFKERGEWRKLPQMRKHLQRLMSCYVLSIKKGTKKEWLQRKKWA